MTDKLNLVRPHLLRSIDRLKQLVEINAPGVIVGAEACRRVRTITAKFPSRCAEAERIAQGVIDQWHPHLRGVAIAYIIKAAGSDGAESVKTAKAPRGGKALKLGSAAAVSEKYQLIASEDYEFIIELNGQYWDRLELSQQEALIDHELCHCRKDDDGFYVADHDLEEFRQIVRRHGFWKPDIQAFCEEAQPLFDKPGIQRRFVAAPPTGDVVVCGGQEVRVEETGDLWTYDVKTGAFVRIDEPSPVLIGKDAAAGKD